ELREEALSLRGGEARSEAHVVEEPLVVVEAQQHGTEDASPGCVAESTDDAVRGAEALHLLHGIAGTRCVLAVEWLRDDAIEVAAGLLEPGLRRRFPRRGWRESDVPVPRKELLREAFEPPAALRERPPGEEPALLVDEDVEDDKDGWCFHRQLRDAALRRMNALEQG